MKFLFAQDYNPQSSPRSPSPVALLDGTLRPPTAALMFEAWNSILSLSALTSTRKTTKDDAADSFAAIAGVLHRVTSFPDMYINILSS